MAVQNPVQVVEKNEGTKIAFEQNGVRLFFGDDDIMIRCDNRQRDVPVTVDVCADDNNNLVIGVGVGRYYVAQVGIPPIEYTEVEGDEGARLERIPLDMGDVIVTLWSIDDLTPAEQN